MNQQQGLHLVECPRDAIQGWPHPISTEDKLAYYRTLLRVGFDTLDMGSFVSPKAIPAMADTEKSWLNWRMKAFGTKPTPADW